MLKFYLTALLFIWSFSTIAETDTTFEDAFSSHSSIMLLIEPNTGQIINANASATSFYGYSLEQIKELKIQQINLLSANQVAQERRAAKAENRNYFIFRHKLADETVKTVQVYSSPIKFKGQELLFSIIRDISSERLVQEQLWHYQSNLEAMVDEQVKVLNKQSEQHARLLLIGIISLSILSVFLIYLLHRKVKADIQVNTLSKIVEQSPISIATLDANGNVTYSNNQFNASQDIRKRNTDTGNSNFLNSYLKHNSSFSEAIEKEQNALTWQGELFSKDVNGDDFWEYANIYPLAGAFHNAKQVIISQNITAQKEYEKELRLASTVFHTATEAVMICDAHNRILAINKAFTEITGYTEQEAIGGCPSLLKSGHHDGEFYQQMFSQLEDTGQWQGEICNRRKNGEVYYEWLAITALTGPTGKPEAYVSLFSDITKRKLAEDKIYHQANYDTLTGLANRSLFSDRLKHCLNVAERESGQVALMFIDLDGFKQINDTLGHAQGDVLLQGVAKRLIKMLRKSDVVSRLGGDEFAVILSTADDIYSIERVASKIVQEVARPFNLGGKKGYVTASIGIALFPEDGMNSEDLLQKADNAMYRAKSGGKNNFQFFTKEMDADAHKRSLFEADLREAVHDQKLSVWFQPIHDIESGQLKYAEALVRWEHPEKGLISPASFIPMAEEIGLINAIGTFVLRNACEEAVNWESLNNTPPSVTVNVSSIQFQQENFAEQVSTILNETRLRPQRLTLEITESLLITDSDSAYKQLSALKNLGVQISLDDFGTGYSSLSYLKRFPVDKLKVDRSFIQDVNEKNCDTRLIEAIYSIAHSLEMEVVAEGVETEFQLSQLKKFGSSCIQGFLFSKPLKAKDMQTYMTARS